MGALTTYRRSGTSGGAQQRGLALDGNMAWFEMANTGHDVVGNYFVFEVVARATNLTAGQPGLILARRSDSRGSAYYEIAFKAMQVNNPNAYLGFGLYNQQTGDFEAMNIPIQVPDFQDKIIRYTARCDGQMLYLYAGEPGQPLRLLGSRPWSSPVAVPSGGNLVGAVQFGNDAPLGVLAGTVWDVRYWSSDRSEAELNYWAWRRLQNPGQLAGLEAYYKLDDPVGSVLVRDSSAYDKPGILHNTSIVQAYAPIHS